MKNRIIFVSLVLCLASIQLAAQAKIKDVVTSDYNRNSLSLVSVTRGDSYDSNTKAAVLHFSPGAKFDENEIHTKSIRIRKDRKESAYRSEISEAVDATPFAREILASIFNRDSNGMMNDKTVRFRGNYDAKDQDVINSRAARVGEDALGDMGYSLVKGSYIVLLDFYDISSKTDKEGKVTWSTSANGYAYRIGLTDETLNDFFEECWIYDDDDQATRDAKLKAFQNLSIPMEYVASASSSSSAKNLESAASSCISGIITGLENAIPQWEVAVGIIATKPLRAKIGTKEGLTNGARYRSYSYSEDDNGNLRSVPRGYLRATTISSNTGMAIGETEPSEFYQISGLANIEEGWTIKQSNDIGIGVAPGLRVGAPGTLLLSVDVDWLMDVKTNGIMQYALVDVGLDVGNLNYTPFYFMIGYGYAFHLTRMFELMPYAKAGMDHIGVSSSDSSESRFMRESSFMLEPGIRFSANVAYPLQVYAKAFYDLVFLQGDLYSYYNKYLSREHKSGIGLQAGVKWTF